MKVSFSMEGVDLFLCPLSSMKPYLSYAFPSYCHDKNKACEANDTSA